MKKLLTELDQTTRLQLVLVAAAFKPAAAELERIAVQIRQDEGVYSATVHCPDAEDLAFDWPDSICCPSLTVECWAGHSAGGLEHNYSLRPLGDGSGSVGPLWVYAL